MKLQFKFLATFLIMPLIVLAEPSSETDLSKITAPPENAPMGDEHKGIQIGLWTESSVYVGTEIRNVWSLTINDRTSGLTTGVGGTLYKNSLLFVTSNEKVVAKIPLDGGIDGMVNPTGTRGGLSARLATLPNGVFELTWKTDTHISNTIEVEISKGQAIPTAVSDGIDTDSKSPAIAPPKPATSPEGTVQNLYDDTVFFGLRSRCRTSEIKRFGGCFTPELQEHLTLCDREAEKWLLENEDTTLKLNLSEGPVFISNYEGAASVSVGKSQIDNSRARVTVSFTYAEDGMLFLWDNVAALRLVDEIWLLDDIYELESDWSLRTRVSIDD